MPEDQVSRKRRWEQAHRDAEFFPPFEHGPKWRARWGDLEIKALHLVDLIDQLEKLDNRRKPK